MFAPLKDRKIALPFLSSLLKSFFGIRIRWLSPTTRTLRPCLVILAKYSITWSCNRYEIFETILGGTYRPSFISHSISYMGSCISAITWNFLRYIWNCTCWSFRCLTLIIVMKRGKAIAKFEANVIRFSILVLFSEVLDEHAYFWKYQFAN